MSSGQNSVVLHRLCGDDGPVVIKKASGGWLWYWNRNNWQRLSNWSEQFQLSTSDFAFKLEGSKEWEAAQSAASHSIPSSAA
jgi:hypothetical protein